MADIRQRVGDNQDMLLIDASRLDAVTTNRFRLSLREQEITALTVHNTLAKKALNESGITALDPYLEGSSTLVWGCENIVALSKEIARWAKELQQLQIKGGTSEGTSLTPGDVDALSKIPSLEELLGQIAAALLSPGANLAGALMGPGTQLASQVEKIGENQEQ